MNPAFRPYTLRTLGLAFSLVAAVAGLNLAVDPFNYFGLNKLGVYISAEREAKATLVRTQPHDALLLGNSKAAMIPAGRLEHYRFFNAAFGGGTVAEMDQFIHRFARSERLVVLCIDLGQYGSRPTPPDRFVPWRPADVFEKTLNFKTLEYSIRTLSSFCQHAPPHLIADGSFVADRWFELYDREHPDELRWKLAALQQEMEHYDRPPGTGLEPFQRIARDLRERHIACAAFIPPLHEAVARHLLASTNWARYQLWQRELQVIFPNLLDFSTGPWSSPSNFFRNDPVHFKPQAGADLLNREVLPRVAAP